MAIKSYGATGFKEEEISSVHLTGAPYMSVIQDVKGNSEYEPGIYARTTGNPLWRLIMQGDITNFITGPLLAELEITKISKRFESLAIINGELNLFSINSSQDDHNSFIKLGQQGYYLLDLVTHRRVALPIIKNHKDIEVYQVPLMQGSSDNQIVLISVKDSNSPIPGSGFTFGFVINAGDTSNSIIELAQDPILLDYEFHKGTDLRALVLNQPQKGIVGIVSKIYLSTLTKKSSSDPRALARWKDDLNQAVHENKMSQGLPYYNLETAEVAVPQKPGVGAYSSPQLKIEQTYDVSGNDSVVITLPHHQETVYGRLNIDAETGDFKIYKNLERPEYIVYYLNGELYLACTDCDMEPIKILTKEKELPQNVSFHAEHIPGSDEFILVLSRLNAGGNSGITETFKVGISNLGKMEIRNHFEHMLAIFYEQADLSQRVVVNQEEGSILFDYKTPKQSTVSAYRQAYRPKALHLDLSGDYLEKTFIMPVVEEKITAEQISYRKYDEDEDDAGHIKTGVYTTFDQKVVKSSQGELIYNKEQKKPYWGVSQIEVPELGKLQLHTIVLDATFKEGLDGFTQKTFVTPENETLFPAVSVDVNYSFPVGNLKLVKIIPGKKGSGGFSIISVYSDGDNAGEIVSFEGFQIQSKGQKGRATPNLQVIAQATLEYSDAFRERDITDRILYDDLGVPYWVETPEQDADEIQFLIRNLITNEPVEPNGDNANPARTYQTYYEAQENSAANKGRKVSEAFEWMVRKKHLKASETIRTLLEKGAHNVRTDLFPQLVKVLNELSDVSRQPKHKVIVVPDDLKPHIEHMILAYWLSGRDDSQNWGIKNTNMELFLFGESHSENQTQYMRQLQILSEVRSTQRAVMFADASKILNIGRPRSNRMNGSAFTIPEDQEDESGNIFDSKDQKMVDPHALFMLAAEGRRTDINDFKAGKLVPRYSQLILTSESEWNHLTHDQAKLEMSYGLQDHYDVIELKAPDFKEQKKLFHEVFSHTNIKSRGYKYVGSVRRTDDLSNEEQLDKIIGYIVTRIENLSKEQEKNSLMAFSDVLVKLRHMLLNDENLRREGVVDRGAIERVLAKVFSLPLKTKFLPENDPLKILSSPDILTKIQNVGGYPGPFDLTRQVVDTILGQTRQETAKAIPASIILDGETGTGKTQLFKSLIKTLDLKVYDIKKDPNHQDNLAAQAFILPVSKLTSSTKAAGLLNVDVALSHLEHFLSLPQGYRGFILFDDLHNCTDEVRSKILARIRTLFDSDDGMVSVRSELSGNQEYVTFPARNLSLFLTYNPTDDNDKIKKYTGVNSDSISKTTIDPKERALAALAGNGVQIDKAFFHRFSLFLNMDEFPIEAKGPGLIEKLMAQSKDFYSDGQFVAVSPELISNIVNEFSTMDARNFLSGAINGIAQEISESFGFDESGLRIIVPYSEPLEGNSDNIKNESNKSKSDVKSEAPIKKYISSSSRVLTITKDNPEGVLNFIDLIVDSFRMQIYEGYIQAARSHPGFAGNEILMNNILSFSQQGVLDHLKLRPSLPLTAINIDPTSFGMGTPIEAENLRKLIVDVVRTTKSHADGDEYFPNMFSHRGAGSSLVGQLTNNNFRSQTDDTRANINTDFVDKVKYILRRYLSEQLHVNDLKEFPNTEDWSESIQKDFVDKIEGSENRNLRLGKMGLGKELTDLFFEYMQSLEKNILVEKKNIDQFMGMSFYDKFRMYMFVIDKAITQLPWLEVSGFLRSSLAEATDSMELGGLSGMQDFLFGKDSILRPTTADQLEQILLTSRVRKAISQETIHKNDKNFNSNCDRMLSMGGVK